MQIALATEDLLSEAVGERLAVEVGLGIAQRLRRDGRGYLRSKIENFVQLARLMPVLLITDLDRVPCAPSLRRQWLPAASATPNLLFRIAVTEVESWLLADHVGIRRLIGREFTTLPPNPDLLADPKATLICLARRGTREARRSLITARGAIASQGLGYSALLTKFVRDDWDLQAAVRRSPSLARALMRLQEIADRAGESA